MEWTETLRRTVDYLEEHLLEDGAAEDAAQAAVYLAKAEYVTGTVLTVDGGFTL